MASTVDPDGGGRPTPAPDESVAPDETDASESDPPDESVAPDETDESESDPPDTDGEPGELAGRAALIARIAAIAVGLVFLAVIGYAVVGALGGDGTGGDNPEAVVEAMAVAASNEDTLGMLALLAPAEVGTFAEIYPDLMQWAALEGLIEGGDLLAGLDIDISGLDVEATHLHPDVAIVELRAGTLAVTADPATADPSYAERFGSDYSITVDEMLAEIQETVGESQDDIVDLGLGELFELRAPESIHLMTVRQGGRWYISPLYSVAEFARRIADLPPADFTASRQAPEPGASSAANVIDDFVDMLNSHRFEDYLEAETITDNVDERSPLNVFVPPDELGVVLDYSVSYRAWLDRINERDQPENLWQIIDDLGLEIRGGVSIDMDTREQPEPDGAVVLYLSSGSINASAEVTVIETGEVQPWEIHMSWDGLCTTGYAQIYDDFQDFEACIDPEDFPGDEDELFIVVRRIDGDWYISYVETALAYVRLFLDDYLSNADRAGVDPESA